MTFTPWLQKQTTFIFNSSRDYGYTQNFNVFLNVTKTELILAPRYSFFAEKKFSNKNFFHNFFDISKFGGRAPSPSSLGYDAADSDVL